MNKDYINEETEAINEFLNEFCWYCGEEFELIEKVLVDVENDRYICKECAERYSIRANENGVIV